MQGHWPMKKRKEVAERNELAAAKDNYGVAKSL